MVGKRREIPLPDIPVLAAIAGTGLFLLPGSSFRLLLAVPFLFASLGIARSTFTGTDRRSLSPMLLAALLFVSMLSRGEYDRELAGAGTGLPPERVASFRGLVVEDGRYREDGSTRAVLQLRSVADRNGGRASAAGRLLLIVRGPLNLSRGMRVGVTAALRPAEPGTGTAFVAFPDAAAVEVLGWASPFGRVRHGIRSSLRSRIRPMGSRAGALFEALFLGRQDDLPASLRDAFRRSGSAHVLALSGMHLGILALLVSLLLGPVLGRRAALLASLFLVIPYVLVAGPSPSLLRAGLMYLLAVPFLLAGRKIDPLALLGASCWILTVTAPADIGSLSFRLSFLALAGVLVIGRPLAFLFRGLLPPVLSVPIAASLGAQIATLPVLLASFGVVYPAGVVTSLVLGPLVTLFVWNGLVFLAAAALPWDLPIGLLRSVAERLSGAVIGVAETAARMPGLSPAADPLVAAVLVAAATVFLYLSHRRRDCVATL